MSEGTPRVSVLIGCWNNADTLERAARSILDQTVRDIELIVVDDGSTDDTPAVVDGLGDPRVRRLALPHMGISRSLNEGLREARAPFVAIQDADDWSEPERLERQLAVLEARPDVAVVGTRMHEVDEAGAPLAPRTSFTAGDVRKALLRFNPIPNSCACMRRDVVLAAGGFDPRYLYAMDYDLWLRVAETHAVVTLDEPLATRRMSGQNVAAQREREQIAETIAMRLRAMRRRRSLRALGGVAVGIAAWIAPIPLKRRLRRLRGQSP
jgi:glycosyltransferase involved in cell wall biosynthesis